MPRLRILPLRTKVRLPVLDTLPTWATEEQQFWSYGGIRSAHGFAPSGEYTQFFFCQHCEGWIAGNPDVRQVNDLGMLTGRRGTVTDCRRCRREIDFQGIIS